MKKLINKIGIITFSLSPILAIALTASSPSTSASPQFKITQSFKTKLKKSFKNSKWVEQTPTNSGSNINNGESGTIFEDSHGNLWSMGYETLLQKYNYTTKRWTEETSDKTNSSGSNIINGLGGTIFEDSQGNLWSMGDSTELQKYDYTTKKWTAETLDSSGSNITDGGGGTIFEDSRGNLWSMGYKTPLQKYNYTTKRWTEETNDKTNSSGSNITYGLGGTIFEDSRGILWSMGGKAKLQKYNYTTKRWTEETKTNSGSNITDGFRGIIFEDSRGNLWSMGKETSLQKYDYTTKKWTAETLDSSGSNITDGGGGTIFEDSRGNLWSMGNGTPLQKYDYQARMWATEISDKISGNGNSIINGDGWTIFEDSRGNLWSMGNRTPLQKYNYTTKRWTKETSESSASKITNGLVGTIFEDSRGNLWSMAIGAKLQKLTPTKETNQNDQKAKDFNIEFKTRVNPNSKIALLIKGYRKYTSSLFTHLRYKKKTESNWKIVKRRTMILDAAEYEFKWVLGTEENFTSVQELSRKITIKRDGSIETIIPTIQRGDVVKVKAFLDSLSDSNFNSLVSSTKLVEGVTKTEILVKIKLASGYSNLTLVQQGLITESLIIKANDPDGTLKFEIFFDGKTYKYSKSGFKLLSVHNAKQIKAFLESLDNSSISWLAVATKLVSQVTKAEILTEIKLASGYRELTSDQQSQITEGLITKTNDPDGTLKVRITYEGETYELNASGFLTIAANNIAKVKVFLNTLSSKTISSLPTTKFVSAVTKEEVLAKIKLASDYSELTSDQQALITEDLISLFEDPIGTLKVTINFKGATYELVKDGFKSFLEAEANKFKSFTSTDNTKSSAASLKASSKNVLNIFKKISGYQRPTNLSNITTITKVIVKKALDSQTKEVTFELTIDYKGEIVKKDVAVKFQALKVISKLSKKGPSGLATGAIVGISLGLIFGIGIIAFLIFYLVRRNKKQSKI